MKLTLTFEESDFAVTSELSKPSAFEVAVKRQLGENVYVGTNSLCLYKKHPEELKQFLSVMVFKEVPDAYEFMGHTFTKADLETLRKFDTALKKHVDSNIYVWYDMVSYYFDYPMSLVERRRPFCPHKQLVFELQSSLPDAK